MPSLRQTRDSDLPPGLISPIYLVWNPMVLVHLINLIKIFGLSPPPLESKRTNNNNKPNQAGLVCCRGTGLGANCAKEDKWRDHSSSKHTANAIYVVLYKGEKKSVKSALNTATRPSALPGVPRDRLWHHNGAPLLPAWALILQRPLDCKPHTLAASPTDPGLYLCPKIFVKTLSF